MNKARLMNFVKNIEYMSNQITNKYDMVDWTYDFLESLHWEWDCDEYDIILKYPDTHCTNVYGQTTPITDLYIRFNGCDHISMRRCSFTYAQYDAKYVHSHVNAESRIHDWTSKICFGPNMSFIERDLPFDEQLIRIVSLLPDFIETESTNNTPYKYISKLPIYTNPYGSVQLNTRLVADFVKNVPIQWFLSSIDGVYQLLMNDDKELGDKWLIENKFMGYYLNNTWYANCMKEDRPEKIENIDFSFRDKNVNLVIKSHPSEIGQIINKRPCEIARQQLLQLAYESVIQSGDFWKKVVSITGTY